MVDYWVIWWRVLGYMVGRVRLHGGDCHVTWWGVLSYIVGSVVLHGELMLDYMEGSI